MNLPLKQLNLAGGDGYTSFPLPLQSPSPRKLPLLKFPSSEETAARQSRPSLASMEASQSPSLASIPSVESSNSGGNNNTNDSKGKKKVKDETWSQAEQKLLVQLWAENHELLESREAGTAWRKSRKS